MKMYVYILSLFLLLSLSPLMSVAGYSHKVEGKVLKIEDSRAHIKTKNGIIKVRIKNLSKDDRETINEGIVSKKKITLSVSLKDLK